MAPPINTNRNLSSANSALPISFSHPFHSPLSPSPESKNKDELEREDEEEEKE
jgi:hypothetical protein